MGALKYAYENIAGNQRINSKPEVARDCSLPACTKFAKFEPMLVVYIRVFWATLDRT